MVPVNLAFTMIFSWPPECAFCGKIMTPFTALRNCMHHPYLSSVMEMADGGELPKNKN